LHSDTVLLCQVRGTDPGGAVPAAHSSIAEARLRTLGSPLLALLLQAQGGAVPEGYIGLVYRANTIQKLVLLFLALFSICSWAIILYKLVVFRKTERQTAQFLDVFRRSNKFSEVQAVCRSLGESPLVGLFQSGYAELTAQLRQTAPDGAPGASHPPSPAVRPTLKSLTAVDRSLMRASGVEVNKLERHIPFLATTASITPFIGLLGTVLGIMSAFQNIGQNAGSTNLGVVAPGIAEALVATAAGLFAAIPAVYFYNHLSQRVKIFASEMDDFAMEFLNIAERNFT
jgi:biopolymer transport protein TolQ